MALEDATTLTYLEHEAVAAATSAAVRAGRLSPADGAAVAAFLATDNGSNGGWSAHAHLGDRLAVLAIIDHIALR